MQAAFSPAKEAPWDETRPVLDEELSRLPEKYRAPLILCCLEGMSHQEAARALGWPSGSMSRRMNRARKLLRERLVRRGVVLSAGLSLLPLLQQANAAAVPAALTSITAKAALVYGTHGVAAAALSSSRVAALAQEVLKTLVKAGIMKGVGTVLLALALLGLIGTTATLATRQALAMIYPNQACGPGQGGEGPNPEPGTDRAAHLPQP